jgi:hypothetical protein
MKVIVAIDDTDNLESRGTGHLAEEIAQGVVRNGWGTRTFITRHQLFVHPDVPYTSHNSAMCFTAEIDGGHLDRLIADAAAFLEKESAEGSDPGLCVAVDDRVGEAKAKELLEWGRRAKREVLTQGDARGLAQRLGVHLSSHGGTGQGVVGALAGVGLRHGGNDGRLRGHFDIRSFDGVASAGEICARLGLDAVRSPEGRVLRGDETVLLVGEKLKAVLLDGKATLLVMPSDGQPDDGAPWRMCPREIVKTY